MGVTIVNAVQFNPSTLKVGYFADNDTAQYIGVTIDCNECSSPPLHITVTFDSNWVDVNCTQHFRFFGESRNVTDGLSDEINGETFVLQHFDNETNEVCIWRKEFSVPEGITVTRYEDGVCAGVVELEYDVDTLRVDWIKAFSDSGLIRITTIGEGNEDNVFQETLACDPETDCICDGESLVLGGHIEDGAWEVCVGSFPGGCP